jgi:hypothetical protein
MKVTKWLAPETVLDILSDIHAKYSGYSEVSLRCAIKWERWSRRRINISLCDPFPVAYALAMDLFDIRLLRCSSNDDVLIDVIMACVYVHACRCIHILIDDVHIKGKLPSNMRRWSDDHRHQLKDAILKHSHRVDINDISIDAAEFMIGVELPIVNEYSTRCFICAVDVYADGYKHNEKHYFSITVPGIVTLPGDLAV